MGTLDLTGSGGVALSGVAGFTRQYALGAYSPPSAAAADDGALSLGVEFTVSSTCYTDEIRWWQPSTNSPSTATRQAAIYTTTDGSTGTVARTATATAPSGSGWQSLPLVSTLTLVPGVTYRAVVFHPAGRYAATSAFFSTGPGGSGLSIGPLTMPPSATAMLADQCSYGYSSTIVFPNASFMSATYWTDLSVFVDAPPSGSDFSGALALTGSGALAPSAMPNVGGPLPLAGSGALAALGAPSAASASALAGAGSLALAGAPTSVGRLDLTGSGLLDLTGPVRSTGPLDLTGSGLLDLTGRAGGQGAATLSSSGALALTQGGASASGALALSGGGMLALARFAPFDVESSGPIVRTWAGRTETYYRAGPPTVRSPS